MQAKSLWCLHFLSRWFLAILSHLFSYLGKPGKLSKEKCADECSSWKLDGCLVPSQARLTLGFLISLLKLKFIWCVWILSGLAPLLMKTEVISGYLVLSTPKAITWWLCWWKAPLGFSSVLISLHKAHDFGLPPLNLECRVTTCRPGSSQYSALLT